MKAISIAWTHNRRAPWLYFPQIHSQFCKPWPTTIATSSKALQLLSNNCRVAIQWILAHCDVSGNEQADKLAKEGATVSYQNRMPIPKQVWCQEKSAYHLLSMSEQVIMIRQRTGHNRMNAHMHEQLKMVPWAACPCGEEDQTKEHIHITVKGMTINDMQLDRTKKKMKKLQV